MVARQGRLNKEADRLVGKGANEHALDDEDQARYFPSGGQAATDP
jgi:hypothetical protein